MRFLILILTVPALYAGWVGDYLNIIPGNRWASEGIEKDSVHSTIGFFNHPSIKSLKALLPHFYSDTVAEYTRWDTLHITKGFIYQGDTAYEREWVYSDELGNWDYSNDSLIEQDSSLMGAVLAFSDTTIYGTHYKIPFEIGKSWHFYPDTIFFEDLDMDGVEDTLWILEDRVEVMAKEEISVPYGNIKDAYKLRQKVVIKATYSSIQGVWEEAEITGFEWYKPHLGWVRDTLYVEDNVRLAVEGIDSLLYGFYIWLHRELTSFAPGSLDVGVVSIDEPTRLTPGTPVTPQIRVGNYSPRDTLDFDVALDIKYNGSLIYSDTASVDFLFPDKERGVSFDEWIPDKAGEYTITAYTLLMGDVHPENDTQSIQLTAVGIREIKTSSFAFITPTLSNEEIKISYQLPYSTEVSINIYNISGKLIKNLVTCYSPQGYYTIIWDRRDTDGKKVPAGIYFVRLLTPRYKKTRKILLAR